MPLTVVASEFVVEWNLASLRLTHQVRAEEGLDEEEILIMSLFKWLDN